MKVLTVYAHQNPRSFCHGVLEHFTEGLRDAGHDSEVIDLYAIKFDPVFRDRDVPSYIADDIPGDILELMDLRAQVMDSCRGPVQRWLAARALRGKSQAGIAALIHDHMPKDVLAQQERVAWADGLAFIAPIHFCAFPAILKGWIDRVWTLDFAFGLTSAGWHGDINGRIPLLHHQRALIMTSTIFDKNAYDDGIRDAIGKVTDNWAFRFPGIADVEHVYFYAATSATPDLVKQYFRQAYQLGRDFERPATGAAASRPGRLISPEPDVTLAVAYPVKNASPAGRPACPAGWTPPLVPGPVSAENVVHIMRRGDIRLSGQRREPVFGRGTAQDRRVRVAVSVARPRLTDTMTRRAIARVHMIPSST